MARHSPISPAQSSPPESASDAGRLIGSSPAMRGVRQQLRQLAPFPWSARIEGERGTGKNVAAGLLHDISGRTGVFVRCGLNVISAGEGREVGELLGWTRGAFTGAFTGQPGVFERAHRGTLFLNELGIASPRVQEILLHVLEEKTIQRLGEQVPRAVDVRVVFATNSDLAGAVAAGRFRADLYDRLGIHVVRIPALRDHMEDIPELAAEILTRKALQAGVDPTVLRPAEIDRLMTHDWPGNVRELENVLEHYVIFRQLPASLPRPRNGAAWRAAVKASLAMSGGNKSAAAKALGVSRKTLHGHLKKRCS